MMKFNISKKWCVSKAHKEDGEEMGVGIMSATPDLSNLDVSESAIDPNIAFGAFVHLMRRDLKLDINTLAEEAEVEISDVVKIEKDPHYRPRARTVSKLSKRFGVSSNKMLQLSGNLHSNTNLEVEAVRFAAKSESVETLSEQEHKALQAFVSHLIEETD